MTTSMRATKLTLSDGSVLYNRIITITNKSWTAGTINHSNKRIVVWLTPKGWAQRKTARELAGN